MNLLGKPHKPRPRRPFSRPRAADERPEQPRWKDAVPRHAGPELAWRTDDGVHGIWLRTAPS